MRCKTLDELVGNEILARDILTEDFQTILPAGATLKPAYIEKLKELNIAKVYIQELLPTEKMVILKVETETYIKEKIRDILGRHTYHHNEELKALCDTADNIIVSISEEDDIIEQVFDIKERSADIYEHSMNLCTIAVLTALKLKLSEDVTHDIGVGCLLHDIGLRYLNIDYENQNLTELSDIEMAEYKKHPVYGYSALKDEYWISDTAKSIILYHHERQDGSGYPLRATTLSLPVQIVSVCDTFDEMICGIGRRRHKVWEAVNYLKENKGIKFDEKVVDIFLEFTAVYPTGTTIITGNNEEAVCYIRWSEKDNRYIIEDDFDSEFSMSTKAEDTLFSLEPEKSVIYMNTFTRTISPAVRVGYMVLPAKLSAALQEKISFYSCTVPVFTQHLLAELIRNGDFERHINRVRRRRRQGSEPMGK